MAASTDTTRKDADKPEPTTRTVTVDGLKVTLNAGAMKRLDVVEAMDDVASQRNPFAIVNVFRTVFGDEQYQDVKAHLAEKHGAVDVDHMQAFFTKAMEKAAPNS